MRGTTAKKLRYATRMQTAKEVLDRRLVAPSEIVRLHDRLYKGVKRRWKQLSKPKSMPSLKSMHEQRARIRTQNTA